METPECRRAIAQVRAYLEAGDAQPSAPDAALRHLHGCPHCSSSMQHLLRAIAAKDEDPLTCAACQDTLPEYHLALMDGVADQATWQPVRRHLATCPACAATYDALADLANLAFGEQAVEPPSYPTPALPFLRPAPTPDAQHAWSVNDLGQLIIQFSADLLRRLAATPPQPSYATFGVKGATTRKPLWQLRVDEGREDLEVHITAEGIGNQPTACSLVVDVNIPSRGGWPNLEGTEVVLKRDDVELDSQTTDAFGKVVFTGIATADLPRLIFEIQPIT